MVTSNFDKFRLLLWKNWILQWNHKIQLCVELILPAIFSMLLVLVRTLVDIEYSPETRYDQPLPIDNLNLLKSLFGRSAILRKIKRKTFRPSASVSAKYLEKLTYHLAYTPNTTCYENIVKEAADSLNVTYSGYSSATEMQNVLMNETYLGGIQFDDSQSCFENLNYKIRFPSELRTSAGRQVATWLTNILFIPFDPIGPRNPDDADGGLPVGYLREGFLPVQNAISTAFLKLSAKNFTDQVLPRVVLQRYPYPEYTNDPLLTGLASMMSFIIVLSYIYPVTYTVKYITAEKEKQLKEVMKIMGLQNWLHWTAWFVKGFLMMGFSSLLITTILMIKWSENVAILTHSSFTAVFFFFLIFTITTITFCFMLATLFSKASTAAAITGLIWFIMYIPYTFFQLNYESLTLFTKLIWSLLCNTALSFGIRVIIGFEINGEGFQWSNMFTPVNVDDSLTMAHILMMMLVSSCIYMIICLYLEQIYAGEYGVPKKWYFPFTKTFWCGEPEYLGVEDSNTDTKREYPESFEIEPVGKHVGLQIKNLTKIFGQRKAVKNLSLNMYEDEITVLLGHNGAGKTTTISMLTGMFPPSSGTAIINGSDIRTNIDGARMSLGICPQHNILFDDLTVRDHLVFYSRLKGLKDDLLEAEVKRYLQKIELENKANVASSKLSGGMKRKLSVCAAFCGGTKVVLCDEPSSGMDPAARRQLWDLLQSEKVGRTILLTTHFMDEADVLGDRIAIMSDGELKCMGTSFFLKKKFGSGYKLICVKKKECDAAEVTKLLNQYIPDLKPEAIIGAELSYQLPDRYSSHFERMFHDLETQSDDLALNGYGISITSLEEVFMKVGAEKSMSSTVASPIMNGNGFGSDDGESMSSDNMFSDNQRLLKGHNLILSQWRSMLWKKILYTIRNKMLFAIQNLMPILFITMTILVSSNSHYAALRPMTMGLNQYPLTVTVLETTSKVANGSLEQAISTNYKDIINSYSSGHQLQQTGNKGFIGFMLDLGKTLQVRINSRYIAAATVDAGTITAWLNNKPLHSAPLTVNLIHNAMAKTLIGPKASITITNAPLPLSKDSTFQLLQSGQNLGTQLSLNLCFCMCFVTALYVMFLIKENQSRAKLLQFVSGVKVLTFWFSHFVWDYVTYMLTAIITILTLACFQEDGYATFDELGRNLAIILLFGFSALPFTYLLSGMFSEPATGLARLSIINIFCGNALFIIILVMSSDLFDTKDTADILEKFFLAFPLFSLAQGLNKLYTNSQTRKLCLQLPEIARCTFYKKQCCPLQSYFTWDSPGVLREVIYLGITTVVFFLILILKEYRILGNIWYKIKEKTTKLPPPPEDGYFDEDVEQEKIRVANMSSSDIAVQNLVLDKVTKFYGKFIAVNQISVGVKHSECFGLLGVNGAGKTTTFKMLTGDERISSGDGYVKGLSLKKDMNAVYQEIGYCPQFDALFDDFTGRETLKIYALLRGIPDKKIPQVSSDLGKSFGFMQHYNKQVRAYSGGNKRKLSTALAVLGSPSVIYLDEPTTGMDPAARRQLWNMVCRIRDAGKSIVLTSHSMEECEALCTRLAIMVNGEFKCIGSTQHLKNKFTKGLILKLKMRKGSENEAMELMEEDTQKVMSFITTEFSDAVLQERFQGILTFYIPLSSILWSRIFGLMESNKIALNIEDYSISQTTLEEIFLQFAKYQRDDPREVKFSVTENKNKIKMSTNNFDKLRLLLWKDWILQWNHKFQLIVELALPAAFSLLLVLIRSLSGLYMQDLRIYNTTFPVNSLHMLEQHLVNHNISFHLAYSPNTNIVFQNIVKEAAQSLNLTYSGYANSSVLQNVMLRDNYLAGIEFDDSLAKTAKLPVHLNYRLRFPSELRTAYSSYYSWFTNDLYLPSESGGSRNWYEDDGGIPVGYLREGFLAVQNAISIAFLKLSNAKLAKNLPDVVLRRYPYSEYAIDHLSEVLGILLPLVIFISFMYSSTWLIKFITAEKEKQLKEVMKMMGLQNWLHWTAWFLQGFIAMGISTFLIVIILTNKWSNELPVLIYSSFTAVLFFFWVYTAATVTFCLMVATFFSKANTAASVSSLIWFVTFIPHLYFNANEYAFPAGMKLGWSLLCNTGMGLGVHTIVGLEAIGRGFQWSNMFSRIRPDNPVTMAHIIAVMLLSCVLNMIICLYIEQIHPGEFGVPKKWYFPFTKTFWCGEHEYFENEDSCSGSWRQNTEAFEAEPVGKRIGLEVKHLSKSFGQSKAVKGVSMNMFEDQITVLLGHNGAGKTTTISMLTGMFPPTSGTAILNGCDIRTNIDGARASLGICPQHNILFDELTVKQHLIFYGRLKGMKGDALETEVNTYIRKIELESKANVASSSLSGGMKRKLSVCAAFCGGSKVVLCDEPSSGMDPAARRQLWDLLQAEKTGRTVLLTTHFMDEADVLGDRIAIMSAGELKCIGTPFFLKKVFGSGYLLVCVKKNTCITSKVTQLLRKYIPDLKPESDIGAELSYQLPDRYSAHFEDMFLALETKSDELSLNGYGISITSLEEVFMKVGAEKHAEVKTNESNNGYHALNGISESLSDKHLVKGLSLTANQWRAMMMKKFLFFVRNKLRFLVQNGLPILFIASILSNGSVHSFSNLNPMTFGLQQYPETVTVLETTSNVKKSSLEWSISKSYKDYVNAQGSGHHLQEIAKDPFIDYILNLAQTEQWEINSKYIAAATVDDKMITAWLNNQPLHSAPLTLNIIHNAMARALIGPDASITVTNSPLPIIWHDTSQSSSGPSRESLAFEVAIIVGFCMCIVSAFYVIFIIRERVSRAKLLQFVSGVKVTTFWLSHFVWDFLTLMITSIVIILTLLYFQKEGLTTFAELGRYFALLLLFGCSALPMTYILAYLFTETSTGLSRLSTINLILGVLLFAVIFILRQMNKEVVYEVFSLMCPHFTLTQGIYKLTENFNQRKRCEIQDYNPCSEMVPYFAWKYPGVLREVVGFIVSGVIYFVLLLLKDYRCFDKVLYKFNEMMRKPPPLLRGNNIDEDVEEEKKRVENMSFLEISTQNLVLDKFSKFYGGFLAVNQISVGVKQSECFGLLGVNGAGKTTTFKILTGDERIFLGGAYVKGMSLKTKMRKVDQEIGYCPQFDALFDDLTGQETLKLFGLLRGIPVDRISDVSLELAKSFGFTQHYEKPVRAYSGGNKRKLSTAVAIMGGPSVLYLDEPTTGMDPAARRQLWNVICQFRDSGKTIILTSHSMEECEALCTRLAIMVNGEFKCIGSTQHLKNRFSKGLVLKFKMRKIPDNMPMDLIEEDIQNVTDFITKEFPEAHLQERFQRILTFYIPLSSISWSRVFGLMEKNKEVLNIEDYSISQTTLEEIFLQFAEAQRNDTRDHKKKCLGFC
ncbi:LOW QUALITY PROTEIN: uncharacterized protein LOC129909731 [Episyrphus balteatus]|uniref:LOW QUALITY PROTEIN: uncharacterized protein LOC129909731 n=1 Tax=Episyrphus balteatus TaxID=286459 RepID=UPI002484E3A6|nr:LOW QUALITY PROTEIN: uncharacterized protein LOC129909731 [Episyrphus balteatus]